MPNSQNTSIKPSAIPTIYAFILMDQYAIEQQVDIKELVLDAHSRFKNDEPYSDFAPHVNDRWHNFVNFSVRVFECTESSGDRNQDVNALLGWFVTSHSELA